MKQKQNYRRKRRYWYNTVIISCCSPRAAAIETLTPCTITFASILGPGVVPFLPRPRAGAVVLPSGSLPGALPVAVGVSKGGSIGNGILVGLVLHACVGAGRQLQDFLDGIAESVHHVSIGCGSIPNPQNIFRVSDGDDQATNLTVGDSWKLPTDQRQYDFFPVSTRQSLGQTDLVEGGKKE